MPRTVVVNANLFDSVAGLMRPGSTLVRRPCRHAAARCETRDVVGAIDHRHPFSARDAHRVQATVGHALQLEQHGFGPVPGAFADLLVVDGDPTQSLDMLADPQAGIRLLMQAGRVIKDRLPAQKKGP